MAELRRSLGRFDLTMVVVGASIGSGIFVSPSKIARDLGSPLWILLVWALGGVMTFSGALTYSELGAMLPRAGGVYVFLTEAYGDLVGFLYGWANILVITSGSIAALAVVFARYVGYFAPLGEAGQKLVAVGALVLVTAVNVYGVRATARMTNALTVLKLFGILFVVVVGLTAAAEPASDFGDVSPPAGASAAIGAALIGVLWSYGGWQHTTFAAAETRNPTKDLPLALGVGAGIIVAVYLLANAAYLFLLSPAAIGRTDTLAATAVATKVGAAGGMIIAATIAISTFGTAGIYTMTAPRMYYEMAQRGLFFRKVAEVHPRTRTPAVAIVVQSGWSAVLVLFWGTFERLVGFVLFTEWIFYALTAGSLFVLRRKMRDAPRPFRVPLYPATPLFFVGVAIWFVGSIVFGEPLEALAGIGVVALGVPVFFLWRGYAPR